jgi:hypothetical protein
MEFGDVIFYSILYPILVILLWLRFLESFVPLWGAWIVSGIVVIYIISRYKYGKANLRKAEELKDAKSNIKKFI